MLECIQRRTTKLIKELEGMSCEKRLKTLCLPNLEIRRLRDDFIAAYNFLRGRNCEKATNLFFLITNYRMQGNDTKLHLRRFRLDVRKIS